MDETTDRASMRLLHFEDCRAAIDQLFEDALRSRGPSAFQEFLDFVTQFNNLSLYNTMLVRLQCPGASAVGSRKQWADHGRSVNPDAVPIVILHPFGPVRFVYEVSDTHGRQLPGESKNALFAEGPVLPEQYSRTRAAAEKYGVKVVETDQYGSLQAGSAACMTSLPETVNGDAQFRFRVKVNAKYDLPTRFATLAHELGHIYCGHLGTDSKGRWPDRKKLSAAQKELEVEAVAWLVCQRNGVKPRSPEYLASLISEENISGSSIYAIFEAANRVESRTAPSEKRT